MKNLISKHLNNKKLKKLLIAPCGSGSDYKYLKNFSEEIYGIDLSPIAINRCNDKIKVKVGDILNSKYPNESFDLIASPLFFHHLLKIGFDPFLKEFYRILKKGGFLIILEPSVFYPLNIITRPLKKITKNIYREVEDEGPLNPLLLIKSLNRVGFINLDIKAATFSHVSNYLPLAKIINKLTKPLLKNNNVLKYFAWLILYWAEKPT